MRPALLGASSAAALLGALAVLERPAVDQRRALPEGVAPGGKRYPLAFTHGRGAWRLALD